MDRGCGNRLACLVVGSHYLNIVHKLMNSNIPRWAWFLWAYPLLIWMAYFCLLTNQELFYILNGIGQSLPIPLLAFFDLLGNAFAAFGLTLFLLLIAPRIFVAGVIGASISGLLGRVLKEIYRLPRPPGLLDQSTFFILGKPLTALSMPSGHAVTAFAIATAYFFSIEPKHRKPYFVLFVVASLTALSRIVVGAHWPNDVLVGASIGLLGGVIGVRLCASIPSKWLEINSWLMYLMVLGSIAGIFVTLFTEFDFPENYIFQMIVAIVSVLTLLTLVWKMVKREGR